MKVFNSLFSFASICDRIRKNRKGAYFIKTCIIVCAGGFDGLIEPLQEGDLLLAADGGFSHLQKLGLTPHGVLGDFDSLGYVPEQAQVFPKEKDDTDSMLSVRQGLENGYRRFVLYGALDGPRLDHTLANLQTLQFLADHGATGYLVGNTTVATVVQNGAVQFPASATGILSVFCMGKDAHGVTLKNLQYPLENGVLSAGFPLGVSNHFIGKNAAIRVDDGSLLLLYDRENGLPI